MIAATVDSEPCTDPAAFVGRHQRGVQRWLRALGCPWNQAEEHCQDALLAALHERIHERPTRVAASWLRTAARNLFWMQLRRERRRPDEASLAEIDESWLTAHGDDDGGDGALAALRACLDAADARDRTLLEQRYRDDSSRTDIAAELGIGEAGVKQALRRARTRLRQCMAGKLAMQNEAKS